MRSLKLSDFQQALGNTLARYGVDFNESIEISENHTYGEGFLDLLKLCDFKKKVNEEIDEKRIVSVDWKAGLTNLISDYKNKLDNKHVKAGYIAAQNGDNIFIEYVLDWEMREKFPKAKDRSYSDYFPVYEHFLGAEIAYILPNLENELQVFEGKADDENYLNSLTMENNKKKPVDKAKAAELVKSFVKNQNIKSTDARVKLEIKDKNPETEDAWAKIADNFFNNYGKNSQEYERELFKDEMILLLYNQIVKFQPYFAESREQVLTYCSLVKDYAIAHSLKLEKYSANEVIEEVFFTNPFEKYIAYKYNSSYIKNIDKKGNVAHNNNHYSITKQHYYFQLECNDKAREITSIGFQFVDTNNALGWELLKSDTISVNDKIVEKIDWQGNQALLAYLIKQLQDKKLISKSSYIETICNHFTVNGAEVNGSSLRTAVSKNRLDIKAFQNKTPPEKQVENITIQIPKISEIMDELEKIIGK